MRHGAYGRSLFRLLGVLILVLGVVPMTVASASSDYSLIDEEGFTVILTEDYYGPIEITASHVTLDCDGFALIGSPAEHGVLINGPVNVTVRNCEITGFNHGIRALNSSGLLIEDNTLHDNSGNGIHFAVVADSVVRGNQSEDNAGNGMVVFGPSENVTVVANRFYRNQINGYAMYSSDSFVVERNLAFGNYDHGLKVRRTTDSLFLWNRADGNGDYGFEIGEVDSSLFFKNKAIENSVGFHVYRDNFLEAADNEFVKNKALANFDYGFIDDLDGQNTYDHNVCDENGGASDPGGLCK